MDAYSAGWDGRQFADMEKLFDRYLTWPYHAWYSSIRQIYHRSVLEYTLCPSNLWWCRPFNDGESPGELVLQSAQIFRAKGCNLESDRIANGFFPDQRIHRIWQCRSTWLWCMGTCYPPALHSLVGAASTNKFPHSTASSYWRYWSRELLGWLPSESKSNISDSVRQQHW